jgi:hypothetical protein
LAAILPQYRYRHDRNRASSQRASRAENPPNGGLRRHADAAVRQRLIYNGPTVKGLR